MKFTVIIPVFNEKERLPELLDALRRSAKPHPTEIVVVDGGSRDGSTEVARKSADCVLRADHPCRACQMDAGARVAKGDILVFLHADTILPESWNRTLGRVWAEGGRQSATAFELDFETDSMFYAVVASAARWRTRITGVPQGDQALAVDRKVFRAVGGYGHTPLMEEYELVRKLRGLGPVRVLGDRVRTSVRRYEKNGRVLNNLRNVFIVFLYYLKVSPAWLARLYK